MNAYLSLLVLALSIPALVAAENDPVALTVHPESIRLTSVRAVQQILVTGKYRDGSLRDLTPHCTLTAEDGLLRIHPGGFLQPQKNGRTTLTVRAGSLSVRVPVVVENQDKPQPVGFRHEVMPALSVAGCNAGACHGLPSGRGGFRLSLRGFDPIADFQELTRDVAGRRTNRLDPDAGLILLKGTGRVPHEGGPKLNSPNPVPAQTLRTWLAEGLRDDRADLPVLDKLTVLPGPRVLHGPARTQQLAVLASFADGSVRDVTRLTVYTSSDDLIARVNVNGLVEFQQSGEVAIVCRHLDRIECARLTFVKPSENPRRPDAPENNFVDRHVFAKLRLMNIVPSDLCSDQVFLRRVHLDLCGILPTSEEVRRFLDDKSSNKRAVLIDRLLDRPEYAEYQAHRWLDLLRSNRKTIQVKGSHAAQRWMREHFANNTPWNQVAAEVLTASGSTFAVPAANYYRGTYDNRNPVAVRDAHALAENTAQLFLGIRMQCAKCHNHPYERWTQDDYHQLAAWFSRVRAKSDPMHPGIERPNYQWQLREDAIVVFSAKAGEVTHPRTGKVMTPKLPGMPAPVIPPGADRRQVLAEQATSPDNPFFAKVMINRIWAHMLGRGIVDPPDDFRDSNPSADDVLLDAMAKDFIAHKFDVKHVFRTIANSRTYQLSNETNETSRDDEKYFSHSYAARKRLSAEVLLDAVCAATGTVEKFERYPAGTRAVQLPDGEVVYTGGRYASWERHPFLKAFGQPARELACDCEREGDVTVDRVLEMKNGEFVRSKIRTPDNRLGKLLAKKLPADEVLKELFLAALSRPPLPHEVKATLDLIARAGDKRETWEAVLWALVNTDEFLFRQ